MAEVPEHETIEAAELAAMTRRLKDVEAERDALKEWVADLNCAARRRDEERIERRRRLLSDGPQSW